MKDKEEYRIIYGGWYQRTVLHLDEIQEFFLSGTSELDLPEDDLKKFRRALKITQVERKARHMDYIYVETDLGITVRYYEDGLYILETTSEKIETARKMLRDYCEDRLNPAISYIFSLGVPTPHKILQSRAHPMVVILDVPKVESFEFPEEEFGKGERVMTSESASVYRTKNNFFVASVDPGGQEAHDLAELHVFLSEFQYQLYSYLNLHREVWENIMKIKDQKMMRGTDVDTFRSRLENYERIVNVVKHRVNQMDIFIEGRRIYANSLGFGENTQRYFDFRFNTLMDTLKYIDRMWDATRENLHSAIQGVVEVKQQSSFQGLRSLQFIMSIGVIAGIIGYMTEEEFPQVTSKGLFYFFAVVTVTWLVNWLVNRIYLSRKYKVNMEG